MRRTDSLLIGLALLLAVLAAPARARQADPAALSDSEFWRLVTEFSEPGGRFPPQYMSNEDSAQHVMPELIARARPGGVYLGVGSEQNFNYIPVVDPVLGFIVDIRRDNMIQVLLYKALFELSPDRATFVSLLFSRPVPGGLGPETSVDDMFAAFREAGSDLDLHDRTLQTVIERLTVTRGFGLDESDRDALSRMLTVFRDAGPDLLEGFGDMANPTYAEMMGLTDRNGQQHGYLTSEAKYRFVKHLHEQNRIVPIVGDFAGDHALASIGRYLEEQLLALDTFYVSNVERYLWDQGEHGRQFYRNVESIPLRPESVFIRSVTADISRRLAIPIPDGPENWRTFLFDIDDDLEGVRNGGIAGYRDLFLPRTNAP